MSFMRRILPGKALGEAGLDAPSELRQHVALEPGMVLQPQPVARAGVRQGEELGKVLRAGTYGVGERLLSSRAEVVRVGVATDEEREPDRWQLCSQLRVPVRRALRPGRKVARVSGSRVAEAHGDDRDAALV